MKKIIAIIMSIILLIGSVSILVSAEDYEPTEEEKAAGFLFGYVFAVIKEEYTFKFDEFTPEMFSSELVESVEELFPYNPDKEYSDFRHEAPQTMVPSIMQHCPHCGKYFVMENESMMIREPTR